MTDYAVTFARSARKELETLDSDLVSRIFSKIEALTKEPRLAGCRKLKREKLLWRIRIGDYRVVYAIYDGEWTSSRFDIEAKPTNNLEPISKPHTCANR
jgi:mRNA interferase RelE/StbE